MCYWLARTPKVSGGQLFGKWFKADVAPLVAAVTTACGLGVGFSVSSFRNDDYLYGDKAKRQTGVARVLENGDVAQQPH